MKIKSDFITNSSSSSFVAYGVETGDLELPDTAFLYFYETELKRLKNSEKTENGDFKYSWQESEYAKIVSLTTEDEKIAYAKEEYENDTSEFFGVFGLENNHYEYGNGEIGFTVSSLPEKFPDTKLSDIEKDVAVELNKILGTSFEAKDIVYIEEAWMDN